MSYIEIDNDEIMFNKDATDKLVVLQSSTTTPSSSTSMKMILAKEAAKTITGITQANPAVVTATSHGYSNDDIVYISSVVGMVEVNGGTYTVANKTTNTFELSGTDSSAFTAYSSGGTSHKVVNFTFPTVLPVDSNAKFLTSDTNGVMSFAESGGTASIDGDFSDTHVGGTGIDDNKTINGAITQLDTWIFDNLVSSPPAPTNLQFAANNTTTMTIMWDAPKIYQIGFLENKTIPFITKLTIEIYKNDAASGALSNGGTVTHTTDSTLTGSGTQFTSDIAVGDSIKVPGATWTTGHPKVKGGSQSGTSLLTDGWTADPAGFSGHYFTIVGHYGFYVIESVTGTWSDNTTEITLGLNRSLTSSPNDDANLVNEETKVVISIESNTSLTVHSNWANAVDSGQTPSFISYESSPSQTFTTTTTDQLPRETATNNIESLKFFIDGGSNGMSGITNGKIISFNASSAVSTTDNTITSTAHPFNTGDSITYSDGGGTQISGLVDGNEYFIIKTHANTIKLASSFANALANTAIGLTAGSSETHTLTRRKKIYQLVDSPAIANTDILKFVIYYGNYNSNTNLFNYGYLPDQQFVTPGAPAAPSGLTRSSQTSTSLNVSWTAPVDNDVNSAGNNSEPSIENYQIVYSSSAMSTSVTRWNATSNSIAHYAHGEQTTTNASTSKNFTSLHSGQRYAFEVSAKNVINASYGSALTGDLEITTLPTAPTLFTSISLTNSASTYSSDNDARKIDNTSQVAHKILDSNSGSFSGTHISYSTISNVATNEANTNLSTANIIYQPQFQTNTATPSDDTNPSPALSAFAPFASSLTHASGGTTYTLDNTKLTLDNQEDKHNGDTYEIGYWTQLDISLFCKKTSIPASAANYYTVGLKKTIGGSEVSGSPKTDSFFVCDLNNTAAVNLVTITGITDTNKFNISGITSRGPSFVIAYNFDTRYLGRYFIRRAKLARAYLRHSGSNISSATDYDPSGDTSFTYSDSSAVSAPIDNAKYIRLAESITFSNPSGGIFTTNTGSEKVSLRITPYNIKGDGTTYEEEEINGSDEFVSSGGKLIYVDTKSKDTLDNYLALGGSGAGWYTGTRVILSSNNSDTPAIASAPGAYDHDESLLSGEYQYELQLVGGNFRTRQYTYSYLDYPTTFLTPSGGTLLDYSSIRSESGYRFATFKFERSGSFSASKIKIDFQGASGFGSSKVTSNLKLYVKLIENTGGSADFTAGASDDTSIWLNGNSLYPGSPGVSQSSFSNVANEPFAVLENGSDTDGDTKTILIPAGTGSNGLTVYIRVGLLMTADIYFRNIRIYYV